MKLKILMRHLCLLLLMLGSVVACTPTETETPPEAAVEPPADEVAASSPDEAITISFACDEYQLSAYETLAEQFHEENPDIKVQVILREDILDLGEDRSWPDDAWQKLARGADTMCGWLTPEAIEQGLFQELTPFIETDSNFQPEDFYPNTLESLQRDGQFWGVPGAVNFTLIFYNRELFDEAGVTYPEPGWTWDDFLEKALALTKQEGGETTQWGFIEPWPNTFIHGRVKPLFDLTTNPPTPLFDTPETTELVRWYTDLHLEHQVMPFFPQPEPDENGIIEPSQGYFMIEDGKAAMWVEFGGSLQWRQEQGDIAVAPFPIEQEGDLTTPMFTRATQLMSAGTAYPEASWRWLSFLTRNPPDTFNNPLPARRSVAEATQFWEELGEELAATYRFAVEHGAGQHIRYFESATHFYDATEAVLAGEKDLETALAEAQSEAQEALIEEADAAADTEIEPLVVNTPVPEQEEGTVITFAPYGGSRSDAFRDLAKSFNEAQADITVKVRQPQFTGGFSIETMTETADCFMWFESGGESQQEHILNLDPFLETSPDFPIDDFYPQIIESFRWRNSLWAIPQATNMWIMYYNQDLFDAAGQLYPQAGWTLDDFLITTQALTQGDGDDKQYGYLSLQGVTSDLSTFIALMDTHWFDNETNPAQFQFDDPALAEAIQWYLNLVQTHQVAPMFEEEDPTNFSSTVWQKRRNLMRQGQAALWMSFGQTTFALDIPDDLNTGIVPLPLGEAEIIPTTFSLGYFINKETPSPEACWSWITYLTEHNAEVTDGLPARRSVAESEEFRTDVGEELIETYLFSIDHSEASQRSFDDWATPGFQWLMQVYGQALEGIPVETALAQAQEKAEAYTACLEDRDGFDDEEIHKECSKQVDPDIEWFGEED